MKSLRKYLLERLVARRPRHAFLMSAEHLNVCGIRMRVPATSPLYKAHGGEVVELPLDRVMTPQILDHSAWQSEELEFFSRHIPAERCVLFDVGANVGLVTRQLMHRFPSIAAAVCFEPHPGNFELLNRNLAHLPTCRAIPAAIGDANGELAFYEDLDNVGNYSLNVDSMRGARYRTSKVRCIEATESQLIELLPRELSHAPILWKSDTQGFDEAIVTRLPDSFWSRVHVGVIEISRIERPPFSTDRLAQILSKFPVLRFSHALDRNIEVSQVLEFASGNDAQHSDLCFARK